MIFAMWIFVGKRWIWWKNEATSEKFGGFVQKRKALGRPERQVKFLILNKARMSTFYCLGTCSVKSWQGSMDSASFCFCTLNILHILEWSKKYGFLKGSACLLIQRYFFLVYDCVGKVDRSKCYWNLKIELGVTMYFSEIIKLQLG